MERFLHCLGCVRPFFQVLHKFSRIPLSREIRFIAWVRGVEKCSGYCNGGVEHFKNGFWEIGKLGKVKIFEILRIKVFTSHCPSSA